MTFVWDATRLGMGKIDAIEPSATHTNTNIYNRETD